MNSVVFHAGALPITWVGLLAISSAAQWLLFAMISAFSRSAAPKRGMRDAERRLILSTAVFVALWLFAFDVRSLIRSSTPKQSVEAAAIARSHSGSCASIARDMTAAEVQKRVGEPDERRPDDEARGPGARIWIYRDSRCAVHLFDEKVEFID